MGAERAGKEKAWTDFYGKFPVPEEFRPAAAVEEPAFPHQKRHQTEAARLIEAVLRARSTAACRGLSREPLVQAALGN